ncbi:hypothetical protein [Nocardiopsis algeriensis]|uniref:Type I restriction enzyme R protein N-terminal domain-containing protein n=1 Tax=Nocardiopsis algeriensis TaxID=1478215 RepID=A0A841IX21_9ACTN|nr:hypothetical protein [Nocardiopsis algeriensis]MBB6121826.1 hypothetical protein [Nocardiopsis algeriensis]
MDTEDTQVMTRTGEFTTTLSWQESVRSRVAAAMDRFAGPLAELAERDANDGDTRMLVADFFSVALNFSKYQDLTTEYRTSGDSNDYAILMDEKLFAPIEVRRINQELDQRSIQMARRLANKEGAEWIYLTNGRVWKVYHLPEGKNNRPVEVVSADLGDPEAYYRNLDQIFHITRESIVHGRLEALRRWREAVNADPITEALTGDAVVDTVLRELREATGHPGHAGDADEVRRALAEQVVARTPASEEE